jgi:2-polyprenyl-6-methoxyphenol hydroxylase-like FAD-dependent oxidoreductase
MAPANPEVLISGASVAGPVLAHWLRRYDFNPTVVERTPSVRTGLGGHAVDLFGPSVDVIERMGVLPEILEARTRTELILFERDGKPPIALNMGQVAAGMSIRHIEILRGELTKIISGAASDGVDYLFGDSIRALDDDGDGVEVTFETAGPRRFDLVVGADGLHSNVRRLVFGDEARFMRYIGGYFAVFTLANYLDLDGRMVVYNRPGRVVGI